MNHCTELPRAFDSWVDFYDSVLKANVTSHIFNFYDWRYNQERRYEISYVKEMALSELMEARITRKEYGDFLDYIHYCRMISGQSLSMDEPSYQLVKKVKQFIRQY